MSEFKRYLSLAAATGLGVGYLPLAPGTWSSAIMAVVCWWVLELSIAWYVAVAGAIFFIGLITVPLADGHFMVSTKKGSDNKQIIIDEYLGMMVTLIPLLYFEKIWLWLGVGLILFRLFDIYKFGLAKFFNKIQNQWGVMLDDFFAGLQAGLVLLIILWLV